MNIIKRHKISICKDSNNILSIILLYLFSQSFKEVVNIIAISLITAYILRPIKELIQKRNKLKIQQQL